MALPIEVNEAICLKLSEPADRCSLRATCRQLLPTVDCSWRDLQALEVRFDDQSLTKTTSTDDKNSAAPGVGRYTVNFGDFELMLAEIPADDGLPIVTVQGKMKNPNSGEWSKFEQTVRSVKMLGLLKWLGRGLPSLKLTANDSYFRYRYDRSATDRYAITHVLMACAVKVLDVMKWIGLPPLNLGTNSYDQHSEELRQSPITATDQHQITDVLLACADATVMGSVVDVSVTSRRLLCDRSLLDALIRWADCRRHAAHNDGVSFWRSLTLEPGKLPYFCHQFLQLSMDSKKPFGVKDGVGEMVFEAAHNDNCTIPYSSAGYEEHWIEILRMCGSDDPEDDGKLVLSLLQQLMEQCESLQTLSVDPVLQFLGLRPTVLHYPTTLTKLDCNRLGVVPKEIEIIGKNCPLLEYISVDCSSIDGRDIVVLAKLNRLKTLKLKFVVGMPLEFTLAVFGVTNIGQLDQIERKSIPWPILEEICVESRHIHIFRFIEVLIKCCPKLSMFHIELVENDDSPEENAASMRMLLLLCRLARLSHLYWFRIDSNVRHFNDHFIDNLASHCPNLQFLEITADEMDVLSLPRLLRGCQELRTVDMLNVWPGLRLNDLAALLFDIAADLGNRNRRVVIKFGSVGVSQWSFNEMFNEIVVGLPPDVRLCHSNFSDICLHGPRRCWRCCFGGDDSLVIRSERSDSLVIGNVRRLHAIVVFKIYDF